MSSVVVGGTVTRIVQVGGAQGPAGPTGSAGAAGAAGAAGVGVPVGGTIGQALVKIDSTDYNTEWGTVASDGSFSETIAGGAGFVNASGAVSLSLTNSRVFQSTMTGDMTGPTFANLPTETEIAASWIWVLRINGTGGYTLTSTPAVTFVDGSSFADTNLAANAVNIFSFWRLGAITYGALISRGTLGLDPYTVSFPVAGVVLIQVSRAETIDLGNVTHREIDGTAGTGTLSYLKNNAAATGSTAFAAGDVLAVTLAGSTTASAVSIPRYA